MNLIGPILKLKTNKWVKGALIGGVAIGSVLIRSGSREKIMGFFKQKTVDEKR